MGGRSRVISMAKVDGRSTLGKIMRQARHDLVQHCGGTPTATQRMMIERAVALTGYIAQLDTVALSGSMTDHRRREYLAADNSLRRTLRELGKGAPAPVQTLADYLNARATAPVAAPADAEAA